MTPEIFDWFATQRDRCLPPAATKGRVLEVGSMDAHVDAPAGYPHNLRPLFASATYFGIDIQSGPGVDEVLSGRDLLTIHPAWCEKWDVAVYTEVAEHDLTWWQTLDNIVACLKPGGWLLFSTCDNGFPRHNHPSDYYRFTYDALYDLAATFSCEPVAVASGRENPSVMALWRKL